MADTHQGDCAPHVGRLLCVMLVAAEASGDALGAALARALRAKLGDPQSGDNPQSGGTPQSGGDPQPGGGVRFVGVGGARMAAEGVASPFDIAELSVLGIVEGLAAYPRVRRRARETAALAARERPDIAVLIDSWGFTLRVAQRLRRLDPQLPLVKYVGPQVWASRPGRAKTLAGTVDALLSIHAFDASYFEQAGLKTVFVGNSSLARDVSGADPERLRARIGARPGDPVLLVLPGSRPGEVRRLVRPFGEAVGRLKSARPALQVVVSVAATVAEAVKAAAASWPTPVHLIEDDEGKLDAMAAATAALTCSGSVTTELALAGCPMVVAYRMSPLTHLVLKRLVTTDWITLFNIAAGREVARERVQAACTGANLAHDLAPLLDHPAIRARQIADQNTGLDAMGRGTCGDPAERAADAVIAMLRERGRV